MLHGGRGLLDRGGLLGGAIGKVVGAREDFAGRGLECARGVAQLPDDLAELFGHGIGVGLELGEGAFIVAAHALGEVGLGQGGEDGAGFTQAAIHRFHQHVDRAREIIQFGAGEIGLDAAREIAGNGRIHHIAEGALQGFHHAGAFCLGGKDLGGFRLGHLRHLLPVGAEHFHGAGHGAEFVRATGAADRDIEVAAGQRIHGAGQLGDGPGDGAREPEACRRHNSQQRCADQQHGVAHLGHWREHFVGGHDGNGGPVFAQRRHRRGGHQHVGGAIGGHLPVAGRSGQRRIEHRTREGGRQHVAFGREGRIGAQQRVRTDDDHFAGFTHAAAVADHRIEPFGRQLKGQNTDLAALGVEHGLGKKARWQTIGRCIGREILEKHVVGVF